MRVGFLLKNLAVFISLALAFETAPAEALRSLQVLENTGLEERLQDAISPRTPAVGLEEKLPRSTWRWGAALLAGTLLAVGAGTLFFQDLNPPQNSAVPMSTAVPEGRVVWLFDYHTTPELAQQSKYLDEIPISARGNHVVMEQGPPSLAQVLETNPNLREKIRSADDLDNPAIREELQKTLDELWNEAGRALDTMRQALSDGNGNIRDQKDAPLKIEGDLVGLHMHLIAHPRYGTALHGVFERAPIEAFIASAKSEEAFDRSFVALYRDRDMKTYLREVVTHFREYRRMQEYRDRAFANQIKDLMAKQPGATIVIFRGIDHAPMADRIENYTGFRKDVRNLSNRPQNPFFELITPTTDLEAPSAIPQEVLTGFHPFVMINSSVDTRAEEAMSIAVQVFDALKKNGGLEKLTKELQDNSTLFRMDQGYAVWSPRLQLYTMAWLNENGYLNGLEPKLKPELRGLMMKDVKQKLALPAEPSRVGWNTVPPINMPRMDTESVAKGVIAAVGMERIQELIPGLDAACFNGILRNGHTVVDIGGVPSLLRVTPVTPFAAESADVRPAGRLVLTQPGLLSDSAVSELTRTVGVVQMLPSTLNDEQIRTLAAQSQEFSSGPKAVLIVNPQTAEQLRVGLEQTDPGWQTSIVIIVVPAGLLLNLSPKLILSYLLQLLSKADLVPGRSMERLEGFVSLDAERFVLFVRSSA